MPLAANVRWPSGSGRSRFYPCVSCDRRGAETHGGWRVCKATRAAIDAMWRLMAYRRETEGLSRKQVWIWDSILMAGWYIPAPRQSRSLRDGVCDRLGQQWTVAWKKWWMGLSISNQVSHLSLVWAWCPSHVLACTSKVLNGPGFHWQWKIEDCHWILWFSSLSDALSVKDITNPLYQIIGFVPNWKSIRMLLW